MRWFGLIPILGKARDDHEGSSGTGNFLQRTVGPSSVVDEPSYLEIVRRAYVPLQEAETARWSINGRWEGDGKGGQGGLRHRDFNPETNSTKLQ